MRNKTFISSMVGIAAAVAGSASAEVTVHRNFASWSAIADTEKLSYLSKWGQSWGLKLLAWA